MKADTNTGISCKLRTAVCRSYRQPSSLFVDKNNIVGHAVGKCGCRNNGGLWPCDAPAKMAPGGNVSENGHGSAETCGQIVSRLDDLYVCSDRSGVSVTFCQTQTHFIPAPHLADDHGSFNFCDFGPDPAGAYRFGNKDNIRGSSRGLGSWFIFIVIDIRYRVSKRFQEGFEGIVLY